MSRRLVAFFTSSLDEQDSYMLNNQYPTFTHFVLNKFCQNVLYVWLHARRSAGHHSHLPHNLQVLFHRSLWFSSIGPGSAAELSGNNSLWVELNQLFVFSCINY